MKRRHVVWIVAVTGIVAACGDADPRATMPSVADAGPWSGNATPPLPPATPLCQGLARSGEMVEELQMPGDAPPMLGGELGPGIYDLNQLIHLVTLPASGAPQYPEHPAPDGAAPEEAEGADADAGTDGSAGDPPAGGASASVAPGPSSSFMAPTGRSAQTTLVVDAYTVRRISLWSGTPERAEAFLYVMDGTTLTLRAVCPTRDGVATYGYSVVGPNLALLVDPSHMEIYTKR